LIVRRLDGDYVPPGDPSAASPSPALAQDHPRIVPHYQPQQKNQRQGRRASAPTVIEVGSRQSSARACTYSFPASPDTTKIVERLIAFSDQKPANPRRVASVPFYTRRKILWDIPRQPFRQIM
jgi:hypothetical protein